MPDLQALIQQCEDDTRRLLGHLAANALEIGVVTQQSLRMPLSRIFRNSFGESTARMVEGLINKAG